MTHPNLAETRAIQRRLPILAARIAWALLSLGVIYAVGYYLAALLTPFGA